MRHPFADGAMDRLTLASASPRRKALLSRLGVNFDVEPSDVDETAAPGEAPAQLALRLAREKARAASGVFVLAADTVVAGDSILGKPETPEQAIEMLRELRGRQHRVLTGVCVRREAAEESDVVITTVRMRPLTDHEIRTYVASGSPLDKAGAYGIQDRHQSPVDRINGCYENVVGLPICAVGDLLRGAGLQIAARRWFRTRDWRGCEFCREDWPPRDSPARESR